MNSLRSHLRDDPNGPPPDLGPPPPCARSPPASPTRARVLQAPSPYAYLVLQDGRRRGYRTPICGVMTDDGECESLGYYNGFCYEHVFLDDSGLAYIQYCESMGQDIPDEEGSHRTYIHTPGRSSRLCHGKKRGGRECNEFGLFNGFCEKHANQDPMGKAARMCGSTARDGGTSAVPHRHRAHDARPAAVSTATCQGTNQKGTQCSRNGQYNGYCHQHVSQDRSGRAARAYAAAQN